MCVEGTDSHLGSHSGEGGKEACADIQEVTSTWGFGPVGLSPLLRSLQLVNWPEAA